MACACGSGGLGAEVSGGYVADLLSCVMVEAEAGDFRVYAANACQHCRRRFTSGISAIVVAEAALTFPKAQWRRPMNKAECHCCRVRT